MKLRYEGLKRGLAYDVLVVFAVDHSALSALEKSHCIWMMIHTPHDNLEMPHCEPEVALPSNEIMILAEFSFLF